MPSKIKPTEFSKDSKNGDKQEEISLTEKIRVNRFTLKNGLKVLIVEDHSSPTFAYQTWYDVGSRNEVPGYTGLAHLFEHMMFKETKTMKDGEFDRILESAGVENENAFTSRDYTAYIQELPKGNLELIARAEADRMSNLLINESAFKTEREVVQNERRYRNENSPDGLMNQELFNLAFTQHPYHWPVIGYQKDLDAMSVKHALDFYKNYYNPNHATVIVVGDINPQETYTIIRKYYENLANRPLISHRIPEEPLHKSPKRKQLRLNIQVEKILMGYPIPSFMSEDSPAIEVLQAILSEGKSSRLKRALVETGIASSVDTGALESKDPSLFLVEANLQNNKHAIEAESIILREFNRISKELVSQDELERAKNRINFSFYESLESNHGKAYFLGHYETIAGNFSNAIEKYKKIQSLTLEDIKKVARNYLNPWSRIVITGVPK